MIAGALIVAVPGAHLLFAIRRAHSPIRVEHDASPRTARMYADEAGRFNVLSAGSHPKGAVNPFALKVLESYGYQATGFRSMSWEDFGAPGPPGWISCSRF